MNDSTVSMERKRDLSFLMQDREVSKVRNKILEGKKKEAFQVFRNLDRKIIPAKRIITTFVCFLVPQKILYKAISIRERGYYTE